MKQKLIELLNLDKGATDDLVVNRVADVLAANKEGASENQKLRQRLEEAAAAGSIKIDPRIRQKMAAGLSFQQAAEVVASQDAEDKAAKKAAK